MRHASRIPSTIEPNELSEIVAEKERNQEYFLNLTISQFDADYDPNPQGMLTARETIARYWRPNVGVDPRRLFLTSSTSEAYSALLRTFCDPQDEILVPQPSYPLLTHLVEVEGCRPVAYALREAEGWFVDLEDLRQKITPKTKMLWIVHPNNPTGSYLGLEQMREIVALAKEHSLAVVSDEVFFEYPLENESHASFLDFPANDVPVFVLGGLSKLLGLPQKKLSWIALHANNGLAGHVEEKLLWVLDLYLSVNAQVQEDCEALFQTFSSRSKDIRTRIRENHATLLSMLKVDRRCRYVLNQGGWNAILRLESGTDAALFCKRLLLERNVYAYPGDWFDLPFSGVVVSLLAEPDIFREGLQTLLDQASG